MANDWQAIKKGHRLQTFVPNVIMTQNANEDAKLKQELEKIRILEKSRLAVNEQSKKAFVIKRTVKTQQLYGQGYSKSLGMLPDEVMAEYKYTLLAFLDEPLKSLIYNKDLPARKPKSKKLDMASLNSSFTSGSDLNLPKLVDSNDLAVGLSKSRASDNDLRLSLPSIRAELHSPPHTNTTNSKRRVQNSLEDSRFTSLVNRLEQKSAWKRKYIPPEKPASKIHGFSLDELAQEYKYK